MAPFHFKKFSLQHDNSTLKISTDAVLLAALTDVEEAQSVLDIGCGCGVIAFCLAQQLAHTQIHPLICGIDPDEASVLEARQNAAAYPLLPANAFRFVQGRVQDMAAADQPQQFDLIVTNPPFYGHDLKPAQEKRLRSKHRDHQLPFEELLQSVLKLLKEDGRFALILPPVEGAQFHTLTEGIMHCRKRVYIQPTAKKPVHRVIQEYGHADGPCVEHHLIIRNDQNEYTEEYRTATKPYLL